VQVDPEACVWCGFPRTLRVGVRRVCFQCRSAWFITPPPRPTPTPVEAQLESAGGEEEPRWCFTDPELGRLRVYRAAMRAGFYTDLVGNAVSRQTLRGVG
jgi:hypothetical protein